MAGSINSRQLSLKRSIGAIVKSKSQEMGVKTADTCPYVFNSVDDRSKNRKVWDKVVSTDRFMLKYCIDRCNTQKMCN